MEKQKQRFAAILVFGGIAFYFGLTHFNTVTHWASALVGLCTPAVIGGIIAFLLNVPMTAIENGLKKLIYRKHPPKPNKALRMVSLLLTFVCIIVVVALAVVMLIPELRKSIMSVIVQIQKSLPLLCIYEDRGDACGQACTGRDELRTDLGDPPEVSRGQIAGAVHISETALITAFPVTVGGHEMLPVAVKNERPGDDA